MNHIAPNADLSNLDKVKEFLANKNVENDFEANLVKAYNYHTLINNVVWDRACMPVPKLVCEVHQISSMSAVETR